MHFIIEPNIGATPLKFDTKRTDVRRLLQANFVTKKTEPENDFYQEFGLILGYDNDDMLEFIEIIRPATVELNQAHLFSLSILQCIDEIKKIGFTAPFEDGGYNFQSLGIVFYCPEGRLDSVAIYRKGYYDAD